MVAATRRVARNITQRPCSLLPNIIVTRFEQFNKFWHGSVFDYRSRMITSPAGNVSQCPTCLKLYVGAVMRQELYESRKNVVFKDLTNKNIFILPTENLSDSSEATTPCL